jgi:hypothetical protein
MNVPETHYRPSELAERWSLTGSKIIDLFQNETDVVRIGRRKRLIIWIPESVAERIYKQITGWPNPHIVCSPEQFESRVSKTV